MSIFCGCSYSRLQPTAQTSVEGMGPLKEHNITVVWQCISKVFRVLFTFVVRISTAVSSQDYFFLALELEIEVERPV